MEMKYIDEMMVAGKNRNTRMNTCPSAILSTENPTHTHTHSPASAMTGRRLAATAVGRCSSNYSAVTDTPYVLSNRPLFARNDPCS